MDFGLNVISRYIVAMYYVSIIIVSFKAVQAFKI